jgi:hypothetical protein
MYRQLDRLALGSQNQACFIVSRDSNAKDIGVLNVSRQGWPSPGLDKAGTSTKDGYETCFGAFAIASGAWPRRRTVGNDQVEKLIDEVNKRRLTDFVSPACFAVYCAAVGKTTEMFEFLEAALAERDPYLTRMDSEPHFSSYRADQRYSALCTG